MTIKHFLFVVTIVIAALVLVGCFDGKPGSTGERLAGSLTELFQQTLDMDTGEVSPIEREAIERAIATGRIDTLDYEAAHVRYAQCMIGNGFEPQFRKTPEGYYINLGLDNNGRDDDMATHWECMKDNAILDQLFRFQQGNPELFADQRLVAIQCLRGVGLIDARYTVDDFERDINYVGDSTFPFSEYDEVANNCLFYAGYAFYQID